MTAINPSRRRTSMLRTNRSKRSGIILLVVLGALTFFSVLIATYLVFSNDSKASSFALSQRATRAPDVNWMMNESLMTLIRGTGDVNNPLFGEDLLSDYYGHDGVDMEVKRITGAAFPPLVFGNGFFRFPLGQLNNVARPVAPAANALPQIDDVFSGRLITFLEGPLENQTFRVLRSRYRGIGGQGTPNYDDIYIQVPVTAFGSTTPSAAAINRVLFDPNTGNPYRIRINGSPRSSWGIGYDPAAAANNVDQTTNSVAGYQMPRNPYLALSAMNTAVGFDLPVSLQPNHIGRIVDKSSLSGDYDEDYDAPDHNNWFLSHQRADGTVIPSFHRPAVLNFILNQADWSAASAADTQNLLASFSRATFRPLAIPQGQLGGNLTPINERFTGGNSAFGMRVPLRLYNTAAASANQTVLDQLARALISGNYDVDNNADGIPDSIWMDLGLPVFTSREGKLLKPLIAPMIEDLSARLNVNAHSNRQIHVRQALNPSDATGLRSANAFWAGTRGVLGDNATNQRFVYRGLGWGPAEILLPLTSDGGVINNPAITTNLTNWLNERYRFGEQPLATPDIPGRPGRDPADLLRFGYRPPEHLTNYGFGYSTDPFGRGGLAVGRSGHVLAAESGTLINAMVINEAVNNPYEMDPSGRLSGDRASMLADLEVILRANEFDSELLPDALQDRLQMLLTLHPEFRDTLTTLSVSDDTPPTITETAGQTPHLALVELIEVLNGATTYTPGQWKRLLAPELRLGRKLDVNRRIGNGIDDNGNGVVDEPLEVTRVDNDGVDNNGNTVIDEPGEPFTESEAFATFNPAVGVIDPAFQGQSPNYTHDDPTTLVAPDVPDPPLAPGEQLVPVSGRQVLARHLYVLMMALTRNLNAPTNELVMPLNHPDLPMPPPPSGGAAADPLQTLYRARRLAQWAVNVVDYCDPDSINTRFVFDPTPFDANGWTPVEPPNRDTIQNPAENVHRERVVWGVESPHLMFSESMAYHDVRLRDTNRDNDQGTDKNDATNPDDDSDQVRMPQGSLFLELYCPQPVIGAADQRTKPGTPGELYVFNGTTSQYELNLAALAPPPPTAAAGAPGAPVWRIAITERHDPLVAPPAPDPDPNPALERLRLPDTASFDIEFPDQIDLAGNTPQGLNYDRFILFQNFTDVDSDPDGAFGEIQIMLNENGLDSDLTMVGANDMDAEEVFCAPLLVGSPNTNLARTLQPGQFLVLAPRVDTRFGSRIHPPASSPTPSTIPGVPSEQRLTVANGVGLLQFNQTVAAATISPNIGPAGEFMPAMTMVIAAPRPTANLSVPVNPQPWGAPPAAPNFNFQNNVVGLSVSEPLPRGGNYYRQPQQRYNGTQDLDGANNGGVTNEDYELTDAYIDYSDPATNSEDSPLDVGIGRIPDNGVEPVLGTIPTYCSAFLQRLADPTIPYDAELNPYITVDWIPIDLTVFSGEERESNISGAGAYAARTRQRNGHVNVPGAAVPVPANALFSYETDFDGGLAAMVDPGGLDFFQFNAPNTHIQSSLSFLNTQYGTINPMFNGFATSIGSTGAAANNVAGNDRNLPVIPYALHPWLNRPYASHLELMMVPACSQARLFEEFACNPDPATLPPGVPQVYPDQAASGTPLDPASLNAPFRHLLNFFHSNLEPPPGGGPPAPIPTGADYCRIFDYVHTLPRYRGEVDLFNPQRLLPIPPAAPTNQTEFAIQEMRELYSPPFGQPYDNQRQARVNLNTLSEFPVWAGTMQGHLNQSEFALRAGAGAETQLSFNAFIESRRGYATPAAGNDVFGGAMGSYNYDTTNLDPDFPTEFGGALRSATTAPKAIDTGTGLLRRRPVNGTVLRGFGNLNQLDGGATPPTTAWLVRDATQNPMPIPINQATLMHDRNRNPFMRYQTVMRMPNLVSDNSQVFVIRMTLGFFEVDADTQNLGREYNADIGQNERFQAMFVVDRSIPVGFDPGKDLNTRDIVIFESYAQ